MGQHVHRGVVGAQERRAGERGLDALLLGGEDEVVEVALERGEGAVDGQGAGHVGGVEVVALDAHVQQHQRARGDRAVVVDPVQRRGVRAAADDRVVADVVAHHAGPALEGALDPALAVLEDLLPLADAVLEAERGRVAGGLELGDLPVVLDQPRLADHAREVLVQRGVGGDHPVDAGRDAAQHAGLGRPVGREGVLEPVDVAALDAEGRRELVQGGAAPDPELAVLAVAEELVGLARGARPRVEDGLAVLDHQDRVAGLVAAEVGVRGVGAEAVVGVVGAHLEGAGRQHQPLAGEHRRQPRAALGGPVGHRLAGQVELTVAPAGAHEGGVGLRYGGVVLLGLRLVAHARHCTPDGPSGARST